MKMKLCCCCLSKTASMRLMTRYDNISLCRSWMGTTRLSWITTNYLVPHYMWARSPSVKSHHPLYTLHFLFCTPAAVLHPCLDVIQHWVSIRQNIVSYLRNTPIRRRRSHSGKPGAVMIANYASITIISNQRKTYTYWKKLTLSIRI